MSENLIAPSGALWQHGAMTGWEKTDRFLHLVATALVTLVIVAIAWGWTTWNRSMARLVLVQEVIQATNQLPALLADMQTLSAAPNKETLAGRIDDWSRWADVPPRLVALRPDDVWWGKSSVSLVWRGPMRINVALDWSEGQGLVIRGPDVKGGSKVLVPPSVKSK